MVPARVREWLRQQGQGEIVSRSAVGGGCISNGARIKSSTGESFFLKTNTSAPPDMFLREAEGLLALKAAPGPYIPAPLLVEEDLILLEDLAPAAPKAGYWEEFGRMLASLHNQTAAQFGFPHDNYLGSTPQPNARLESGHTFFAQHRLKYQAALAQKKGLLPGSDAAQVERLADRLPEFIPSQPASLIHGDLWSGNALTDAQGAPALIDPAAHYGWAEAELAMTALFGSFPERFYQSYEEVRPLEMGYRQRFALYNLYHVLNHLNLFGSGYLAQVKEILRQYR
jgi:protein-ribulosamine 3-kinase